ncbi:MAG: hypothetical protein JO142_19420 [Burkholderiales bacterium]|nr:hypothetical protein [Burkholderiales bacterium]
MSPNPYLARISPADAASLRAAALARDLHDGLTQTLTFALMQLDAAQDPKTPTPTAALQRSRQLVKDALQAARQTIRALTADTPLPEPRLTDALRQAAEEVAQLADRPIQVACTLENSIVPAEVGATTARAVHELLINACKHAPGATVKLGLAPTIGRQQGFVVTIADDGPGFDMGALRRHAQCGFGLHQIALDLAQVDAELRLQSRPGAGVVARITWYASRIIADRAPAIDMAKPIGPLTRKVYEDPRCTG